MSAYGPALFLSRRDGTELDEEAQEALVEAVAAATKELGLKDEDDAPLEPTLYDYDGYEPKAVGVLLFSSYAYGAMPEEVQADYAATWEAQGDEIARRLGEAYDHQCYFVED